LKRTLCLGTQVSARSLNHLLGWLIAGTRGGPNRARIIEALTHSPLNINQLALVLKISYKTAKEHCEILEKNHIVTALAVKGGTTTYCLSQTMLQNYQTFEKLLTKINERAESSKQ
jgi:predicted ArsR family transcriptional regulator